jgi:hypothetical protein
MQKHTYILPYNLIISHFVISNNFLTLSRVLLDTGTNFPAVRLKFLLATAMMKTRQRWKETGVPTQLVFQTASAMLLA